MSEVMKHRAQPPSSNPYVAADWLRRRHPRVAELVARVAGRDTEDWVDELARAIGDCVENNRAWDAYERVHRAPDDNEAWEAWHAAGPENTGRGSAFAVMSSGEQNLVRLVATLARGSSVGDAQRVPWSVHDISFDQSGAAVVLDWLQIVRAQLLVIMD